jgi:two-component system, cell cycle response regulator DivK
MTAGGAATRVLIVDDNPLNIVLANAVLEPAGFLVESAVDADEALARIGSFRPALILMDIQLPGVDGLSLTQQLKADPVTRQIVIIAFTAYAMKDDQARLLAGGCDGYIAKPINVATFAQTVRSYWVAAGEAGGFGGA